MRLIRSSVSLALLKSLRTPSRNVHRNFATAVSISAPSYLSLPPPSAPVADPPGKPSLPPSSHRAPRLTDPPSFSVQPTAVFSSGSDVNEDLFRYTSGRWLYNESQQMAQRYVRFDVAALHRVIASVCGAEVVEVKFCPWTSPAHCRCGALPHSARPECCAVWSRLGLDSVTTGVFVHPRLFPWGCV